MAQETNHSQVPMLCSTGCGFYGNPRTNGMCSVCYKEHLQRQNSSNGRISPPAASVGTLSESFPVQCADGSVPDAQSPLDSTSASVQPSPVSNQSLLSESVASSQVDSTSVDKAIPDTEDLQVARIVDCERNGCCGQTWQQLVSTATEDEDRVVNVHHACVEDGVAFCTEWPWQQEYQSGWTKTHREEVLDSSPTVSELDSGPELCPPAVEVDVASCHQGQPSVARAGSSALVTCQVSTPSVSLREIYLDGKKIPDGRGLRSGREDRHREQEREGRAPALEELTGQAPTLEEHTAKPASVSDTAQQPSEEQSKSLEKPKQKKNRCFMCRKKVGLTGFECRCGHVYCGVHRYSDVHNCSYNYKADAAEKIRKENPVVVGEKIQKI